MVRDRATPEPPTEDPVIDAPSDIALVRDYLAGDSAGFDELFRRYHGRIRAVCQRTMGDDATADDMVQETFCKVLRSVDHIDETFNFSGWIHRIAANVCLDELRRRQRRSHRQIEPRAEDEDAILRLADPEPGNQPELALEAQRMRSLVWEVSKRLPERQRTVLALREVQGLSYTSIARFLGVSESAVETLLHRARRRFRAEFILLEGPKEDEGTCTLIIRLARTVGRDHLQSAERDMVDEHVRQCSWCKETLGDTATTENNPKRRGRHDSQ